MERYYDIRIPDTGHDFEILTKIVCEHKFGMHFELYGRNGQEQSGIDLFSNAFRICVQCKNYQGNDACNRLLAGIKKDFLSAYRKFGKVMSKYVLATTVQRDARIQDMVSELTRELSIDIQILFWEDFQGMLKSYPEIIDEYNASISLVVSPGDQMMTPEVRVIGKECYIYRSSKTELVSTDNKKRMPLTVAEYSILSFLIDNQDTPVSVEEIAQHIGGKHDSDNTMQTDSVKSQISRIRQKLDQIENGLGKTRLEIDYRLQTYTLVTKAPSKGSCHEIADPSLACTFLRGKDNSNDVFILPGHFIIPRLSLRALLDSAFKDSNVHVISGQRGMGKSELARCFSRVCCGGTSCREDLQYRSVIWTTYSEKGLKDTISKLNYSGDAVDSQHYSDKIHLLCEIEKPSLLVIDNFDNETSFTEELSSSSAVYLDLLQSGCHILFTSKVNLSDCYAVRQTEILPLPESDLNSLFWTLSEEEKTKHNQEKVTELIEKYLDRNTYLVILASKLTATAPLDDILKAFMQLSVAQMADPVSTEKDGIKQPSASLFSQYQTMFNLSSVQDDEQKIRLLYNLALLPIDGVPYSEFFSMSFAPEEQGLMKLAFSQLRDGFWVFLRHRHVCIHPLIREMIISSVNRFSYSCIQQCIRYLNDRLFIENYTDHTCKDLELAVSAYEVCEKLAVTNPDITMLISNVASTYDLVKNSDAAYYYSKQAIHQLRASPTTDSFDDNLALAICYNMVGYAILHSYTRPDSKEIAEKALLTAKEMVEDLFISNQDNDYLVYLCTKIQGNLAALYITKNLYDVALDMHTSALNLRLQLAIDSPSPRTKLLLAAAYKGIATDYFYLSRQQDPQEALPLLQSSLENHSLAVALYEEVLSSNSLEASIANNRLISTGITWITTATILSQPVDFQTTIAAYIEKTLFVARYLCSIEPIVTEISICISNAERLAKYLDSVKCDNVGYYCKLESIANLVFSITSEKKSEWIPSISTIHRITLSHTQEEKTYE